MDLNAQKEQFSRAYVFAVAAVAGYATYTPSVDDDSIDLGIARKGGGATVRSPRLEIQLKCTAAATPPGPVIRFPLSRKNYDDLRDIRVLVPRILTVVLVPDDPGAWLAQSDQEMAMRRCGYWLSIRGMPDTENSISVTVEIARAQMFSVDSLRRMMDRISQGELL